MFISFNSRPFDIQPKHAFCVTLPCVCVHILFFKPNIIIGIWKTLHFQYSFIRWLKITIKWHYLTISESNYSLLLAIQFFQINEWLKMFSMSGRILSLTSSPNFFSEKFCANFHSYTWCIRVPFSYSLANAAYYLFYNFWQCDRENWHLIVNLVYHLFGCLVQFLVLWHF